MTFRAYDPALGRFTGVDLLAELQYEHTPYHFGYGNPNVFADPSGLFPDGNGRRVGERHSDSDGEWEWDGTMWVGLNGTVSMLMEVVIAQDDKGTASGATVYIENDGVGHAYIEVNGFIFSYGRYDGSYSPSSGDYGPVGRGVLLKKEHYFAQERMEKYPTTVYYFPSADGNRIYKYLNTIYNSGTPTKNGGMIIDTYVLVGNNCTSLTSEALRIGGIMITPLITSPSGFNTFMKNPSFYNTNNNWLLK